MTDAATGSPVPATVTVDSDVVIVGCGPVGLGLAIALGMRGHTVSVVERWPAPYPLPRAVHFDHEVGRILAGLGIADTLRACTEPAEVYEWRNADGVVLLRFGRIGLGPSGWPESSMFSQPDVEAALNARAGDLDTVTIHRGLTVTGVSQHGDGARVVADDGTVFAGRYVVGCDGANSTVRAEAGIAMVDLGFFHDWLIVDVILDEPRVFDPINVQICDPARPTTMVSGGPGRRRWEFMALPGETLDELNAVDRAWELLAPWDVHPANATLERHAVYTFGARYAERWRDGRVLLAGDAAHLMPPFAGQGMCAGVRDAANLAWKLDAVLSGVADEAVLDAYELERLPGTRAAIEFSMELGRVICVADPAEAAARDAAMAPAVGAGLTEAADPPPLADGVIGVGSPGAGTVSVQGTTAGVWLDEAVGTGWRLIAVGADPDDVDAAERQWFASLGGTCVAVAEPGAGLGEWFGSLGARYAVIRPDHVVFATAANAAGATAVVADLRRQLAPPPPTGTDPDRSTTRSTP